MMALIRGLVAISMFAISLVGALIALAGTIALGPLFFVPYLIVYVWLRISGLTPKQIRKDFNDPGLTPVMQYTPPEDLWDPLPASTRTDHAPFLAYLPDLPAPPTSIFDNGEAPLGPSSLD